MYEDLFGEKKIYIKKKKKEVKDPRSNEYILLLLISRMSSEFTAYLKPKENLKETSSLVSQ